MVSDGEEFNEKITRINYLTDPDQNFAKNSNRSRSSEPNHLPLHQVQEAKGEDDYPKIPLKTKFYLENILDMNEFNTKEQQTKSFKPKKIEVEVERTITELRRFSSHNDSQTIFEDFDQENKKEIFPVFYSNTSSNASSHHSSPRFRLKIDFKVDELELNTVNKKFMENFNFEERETIVEETIAEEGQENKLLQTGI